MAYTVDYGVPSLEINITTAQDGNLLYKYYPCLLGFAFPEGEDPHEKLRDA